MKINKLIVNITSGEVIKPLALTGEVQNYMEKSAEVKVEKKKRKKLLN